ncbi:hypothetical protein PUN28_011067 [Cardiocondyla obscurior]|uniref:Uncharacterized protein n=1 Tax=Cardiocondyla obscurior TaxID=286306 RepID=A0AAW2FMF7_9HYME
MDKILGSRVQGGWVVGCRWKDSTPKKKKKEKKIINKERGRLKNISDTCDATKTEQKLIIGRGIEKSESSILRRPIFVTNVFIFLSFITRCIKEQRQATRFIPPVRDILVSVSGMFRVLI